MRCPASFAPCPPKHGDAAGRPWRHYNAQLRVQQRAVRCHRGGERKKCKSTRQEEGKHSAASRQITPTRRAMQRLQQGQQQQHCVQPCNGVARPGAAHHPRARSSTAAAACPPSPHPPHPPRSPPLIACARWPRSVGGQAAAAAPSGCGEAPGDVSHTLEPLPSVASHLAVSCCMFFSNLVSTGCRALLGWRTQATCRRTSSLQP